MGRRQCNNTFNNIKGSLEAIETSDSKTARPEHSKANETEENNLDAPQRKNG